METVLDNVRVTFIGMGEMGEPMAERIEQTTGCMVNRMDRKSDPAVLENTDIAVVCMRPRQWSECDVNGKLASERIAEHLNSKSVLAWIAAGLTTKQVREDIHTQEVGLVRAMLTRAVDGDSLTALCTDEIGLTALQRVRVEETFRQCGDIMWLDEDLFADFTALVGSGLGFHAEIAESFRRIAIERRFTKEQADKMHRAALRGAASRVAATGSAAAVVREIETEGGTTHAGLHVLRLRGIHRLLRATIKAAANRSRELAKS